MQLTKYKLGDLIAQRREKNKDYDLPIRGVSREGFIKPKIEDADTSIYNVFYRNDFVFNPARMELSSIALNLDLDKALCSSLYEVFYVKDENVVLPEFLNLHIKRDEFARHCDYIGLGSAREYCRFANIAEFDIKIPSIEVQREIVQADRQIKRRIRLNEQMIEKLEATAQALYRKMFVDGIDKDNLPEGWKMGTLGDYVELSQGIQVEVEDQSPIKFDGYNRFIRIIDYTPNTSEPPRYVNISNERYFSTREDVIMIRYGDAGTVCRRLEGIIANNLFKITPTESITRNYVYHFLKSDTIQKLVKGSAASSTMPAITHKAVKDLECLIPPSAKMQEFDTIINVIEKDICLKSDENSKLTELQSLLLAKMGQ